MVLIRANTAARTVLIGHLSLYLNTLISMSDSGTLKADIIHN